MFSIDQLLIHPNDGELEHVPGFATLQKLTAEQTDGAFSIVEHPIEVGVLVAPVHTHSREDEYSYVLQGQVGVMIGGEEAVAGPGTYVCKPRGIPHTF